MKKIILYLFPASIAFLPVSPSPQTQGILAPDNHQFAFHLLKALLEQDTSRSNKLISPLNLYLTVAMLCNGAANDTRDSITGVLGLEDIGLTDLNVQCRQLQQQLPLEDDQVEFSIANSVWYNRKKVTMMPAFESVADLYYYSPVQSLNFKGHKAAAEINQWADQVSHHRIRSVFENSNPGDGIYVISTTYFKSGWTLPFDVSNTVGDLFHLEGGSARTVPFMRKKAVIQTYSDTSFTLLELPFGNGSAFSLYIVLPEEDDQPLAAWTAAFDPAKLTEGIAKMTPQYIDLSLPRWEYNYSAGDLRPILSRLGMGNTFTPSYGQSDLSNMYAGGAHNTCISQVIHATCIRVNESGMEESNGEMHPAPPTGSAIRHSRPIRADRPFLYFIMEKRQHLMLLAGILNDPLGK